MELFASEEIVSELDLHLTQVGDAAPAALLTELAWHLRQRETRRALALVDRVEAAHAGLDIVNAEARHLSARIALIRAEADWLFGRLDLAMDRASQAVAHFLGQADHAAAGDGQWTMACIWHEQGAFDRRDACLASAAMEYAMSRDSPRGELVAWRIAYHAMHRSAPDARHALPEPRPGRDHPMILAWKHAICALSANLNGQYGVAIAHSIDAHESAVRSGQGRQAIVFAMNVGNAFEYLNDLDAAVEWIEIGMQRAEAAQWPALIGLGWYYVGAIMIKLNRPEEAMSFLRDAVRITAPFGESANYNAACLLLGSELMKSAGHEEEALTLLRQGQSIARRLGTVEALFVAGRDLARLLIRLGRFDEASREIEAALGIARDYGNGDWLLSTLRVQADLRRHGFGQGADGQRSVLACLDQALEVARTVKDFIVPADLLEEVAAEHAKCGDLGHAYALVLEAGQSRERVHGKEAGARAVAMQVRHDTARLRAEAQHQRLINEAQAQRADELQQSLSTLEELGGIGRQITSHLYADELFEVLHRHAQRLLDAMAFIIFRFDAERSELDLAFGVEAGQPIAPSRIAIGSPTSFAAKCAREQRDVVVDKAPDTVNPRPGTIGMSSLLYAPLLNGDQLVGVMSIQSPEDHAYGERERAIFRTLCAYGAIALANVQAMAALKKVEAQLVQQNAELAQMAITDRLTGLANRLYLDRQLQGEFAAAERYGTVFSLILLDLDHFKSVNDTHGHLAGDAVLVGVADILQGRHRRVDMVGRWGGEEFLVVCPHTSVEGAWVAAECLRRSVEQHEFPTVGRRTASFGVAAYRVGDTIVTLTARADEGLYAAKASGRNRVVAIELQDEVMAFSCRG